MTAHLSSRSLYTFASVHPCLYLMVTVIIYIKGRSLKEVDQSSAPLFSDPLLLSFTLQTHWRRVWHNEAFVGRGWIEGSVILCTTFDSTDQLQELHRTFACYAILLRSLIFECGGRFVTLAHAKTRTRSPTFTAYTTFLTQLVRGRLQIFWVKMSLIIRREHSLCSTATLEPHRPGHVHWLFAFTCSFQALCRTFSSA